MAKTISLRELINPTPRQEEFLQATDKYKYPLFGGAKGGGKSYILRWGLVRKLVRWAKIDGFQNVRVGLFCEDYPALKDRQITKMAKEFPEWLGTLSDNNIEGMSFRLHPQFGGGIIALRNLDDPSKYASSEFAIGAVDELTKNKREVFDQLRSIIRWPGIEKTGLWSGTNPGEIGHEWVKKLWIDRIFGLEDPPNDQFYFIKSLPTDNPHNAQSYLEDLRRLPEKLRKAYWEGNWDVFEGQFFSEWDKEQHVVEPFTIPPNYKRFRSYDHGRENPATCGWYALDYDGRLFKYREFYQRGMDVDQIAARIKELSMTRNEIGQLIPERYEYSVADPSIFANIGYTDKYGGQTIAETFARNGIVFIPASNKRVHGWNLMHQYLRWGELKKPKLQYFNTCYDSIRTIPSLIHDEHQSEDVDTDSDDHCFVGDTLVDTLSGKKKIKDLVEKEVYVNTRFGFQKCRSVRKTRVSEVWKVTMSNGDSFNGTPDHKIFTDKGWKLISELVPGYDLVIKSDICIKSYLKLFRNLMVSATIYVAHIFKERAKDCILQFGNIIKEIFPMDSMSTTKITISSTTTLPTWFLPQPSNTYRTTPKLKKLNKEAERALPSMPDPKLQNGTALQKAELGIVCTPKKVQKNGSGLRNLVWSAMENIKRLNNFLIGQNIAISIAKCEPCGEEEVYDLTVPATGEFTINGGLVVHNCADTDRYLLMSLHESSTPAPLTDTEKKFREMMAQRG